MSEADGGPGGAAGPPGEARPAPALDDHKLAAARLWATTRHPYLAAAVFAAPTLPAPGLGRLTIDRWWRVHADPEVVAAADVDRLGGELLHLVSHVLRDHADRADAVGLSTIEEVHHWGDAADAEIHDDFPADVDRLEPTTGPAQLDTPEGRLAEEYYRRGTVGGGHTDCGSGAHGRAAAHEPPPPGEGGAGVGRADQHLLRRQVAAEVARSAAEEASASLRAWAEGVLHRPVDWRRQLAAVLRRSLGERAGAVDYSYRRPSRRASAVPGVVLAGLRRPTVEVAVVCDTSASVTDDHLARAVVEIDGVLRATGTRSVRVLACDAAVHTVQRVASGREVTLAGGGGTDLAVGLAAAVDLAPRPDVVVVVTDGFTPWPDRSPQHTGVIVARLDTGDPVAPPPTPGWARTVDIPAHDHPSPDQHR